MNYAVIRIKGQQYKVTEGEELLVDKISEKTVEPEVLLVVNDEKINLGTPTAKGAKVVLEIIEDQKGTKLTVRKFKSKSRYRRTVGFRPQYTLVKVKKISG